MRCSLCLSLQSTRFPLPNVPGCQRSPHICTSKGGWPGADSQGRACDPDPGSVAGEPAAPENPVAAGEAVHTNPDSWCSRALGHRKPGSSGSRTCDPVPPPWRHLRLWPPTCIRSGSSPTTPHVAEAPTAPAPPPPALSPHGCRAPDPSNPGRSAGTHHPRAPSCGASDSSDTGNSKAPATPETQAATTRAPGDTSGRGRGGGKVLTLKYSQRQPKRNQKLVL